MLVNSGLTICAAVLAAGQSRRFGAADKLAQPLDGTMLGLHVCGALQSVDCTHSIVITSEADHPCTDEWRAKGFEPLLNDQPARGMGTSVALAASFAAQHEADALLICLADMPFVPVAHLLQLIEAYDPSDGYSVVVSDGGNTRSPPALFGAEHFPQLATLDGDTGARELLAKAHAVPIVSHFLSDIDTLAQLEQANALMR